MKYQVPQYIDIEDKIFGPFTFRQFAYMIGGGGICYLSLKLFPIYIAILIAVPVGGLAGALAFIRMNGKPFINVLESGFSYMIRRKLYLWKKDETQRVKKVEEEKKIEAAPLVRISESKLHDISWGLDVLTKDSSGTSEK